MYFIKGFLLCCLIVSPAFIAPLEASEPVKPKHFDVQY